MTLPEFFALALWLSFGAHLVAAEIWIHWTRLGHAAVNALSHTAQGM